MIIMSHLWSFRLLFISMPQLRLLFISMPSLSYVIEAWVNGEVVAAERPAEH